MAQDNGKFVWFLAGAAVGASLALLYAPQPGHKTRRLLVKKTREGREAFAGSGRELLDKGRELYKKGRQVADDAAEMIERGRRLMEG